MNLICTQDLRLLARRAKTTTTTKHFDEGIPMDVVYLDFSKAFDKVPHKRLLRKLEALGIHGKISQWVEAWLLNRVQRTV